jgi:hypothetical protein
MTNLINSQCSIEQVSFLDLVLHVIEYGKGTDHNCDDPQCIAPGLYESYQKKYLRGRDRNVDRPIGRATKIILQSPSICPLWKQFCSRTCLRGKEHKEMEEG